MRSEPRHRRILSCTLVPKSEEKNIHPIAPTGAAANTNQVQIKGGDEGTILRPGFIDFRQMDVGSVVFFYAELVGGKPAREWQTGFHGAPIILTTETAMTAGEAKYALDTLFAWRGFKTVRSADDVVRLEPLEPK